MTQSKQKIKVEEVQANFETSYGIDYDQYDVSEVNGCSYIDRMRLAVRFVFPNGNCIEIKENERGNVEKLYKKQIKTPVGIIELNTYSSIEIESWNVRSKHDFIINAVKDISSEVQEINQDHRTAPIKLK